MALYNYIAKNKDGQEVRSSVEVATRLEALESLRKKGLTVVDLFNVEEAKAPVVEIDKDVSRTETKKSTFSFSSNVKLTDLAIFCRQLAISVNAGVPLRDALEGIGEELEQPMLKRISLDMVQQLHDGVSFSGALAKYPKVFNEMFQGLIKVAEESGRLPSTLEQLSDYLERTDRLRRRIKAMSAYPIFIGVFFIIILAVMTLFIMPQFTKVFAGFGADLPALTRFIFGINDFVVEHFLVILVAVGGTVSGIVLYGRTAAGSLRKDQLKLKMPLIGTSLKKYMLARFCRSLSIMVHSGVPISTALEICADSLDNQVLRKSVLGVRELIITGNRIAASLEKAGVFPGLVIRMVGVGEDSGQLPEVLDKVSDLYEDQVEVSIMTSMAMFEPLVIVVFGAFIMIMIMAIYLPIFTVSMQMK